MIDNAGVHGNPYLPSVVTQQPKIYTSARPTDQQIDNVQIRSVSGYDGARKYTNDILAPGCSNIIADSNPNIARIYIVGKDQNGQIIVNGFNLTPYEEPKQITMEDINNTLVGLSERMTKIEEAMANGTNFKPGVHLTGENIPASKSATGSDQSSTGNGTKSSKV